MSYYPNHLALLRARREAHVNEIEGVSDKEYLSFLKRLLLKNLTDTEIAGGHVSREDWQLAGAKWAGEVEL